VTDNGQLDDSLAAAALLAHTGKEGAAVRTFQRLLLERGGGPAEERDVALGLLLACEGNSSWDIVPQKEMRRLQDELMAEAQKLFMKYRKRGLAIYGQQFGIRQEHGRDPDGGVKPFPPSTAQIKLARGTVQAAIQGAVITIDMTHKSYVVHIPVRNSHI
jgi:hypothetical protein